MFSAERAKYTPFESSICDVIGDSTHFPAGRASGAVDGEGGAAALLGATGGEIRVGVGAFTIVEHQPAKISANTAGAATHTTAPVFFFFFFTSGPYSALGMHEAFRKTLGSLAGRRRHRAKLQRLETRRDGELRASAAARMPTLPGNLMVRHCLSRTTTLLRPSDLRRVLIVRSFKPQDPLRPLMIQAIEEFQKDEAEPIQVQLVDVDSREEFVQAFNDFDGHVAVFDGHGSHQRNAPQGVLQVGDVRLNPFEMYREIRVPPIIFLSACDTHPLEGIESSVGSAFLFMGAQSVLGTTLPVHGGKAAILVARFLYRFVGLLPFIRRTMPWPLAVTGMLRMSYVTDVLRGMMTDYGLSLEEYRRIHSEANLRITYFDPGWFEFVLASVARSLRVAMPEIRDHWLRTHYFTDTLCYVHLGQPEHLFIVPEDLGKRRRRDRASRSRYESPPSLRSVERAGFVRVEPHCQCFGHSANSAICSRPNRTCYPQQYLCGKLVSERVFREGPMSRQAIQKVIVDELHQHGPMSVRQLVGRIRRDHAAFREVPDFDLRSAIVTMTASGALESTPTNEVAVAANRPVVARG